MNQSPYRSCQCLYITLLLSSTCFLLKQTNKQTHTRVRQSILAFITKHNFRGQLSVKQPGQILSKDEQPARLQDSRFIRIIYLSSSSSLLLLILILCWLALHRDAHDATTKPSTGERLMASLVHVPTNVVRFRALQCSSLAPTAL